MTYTFTYKVTDVNCTAKKKKKWKGDKKKSHTKQIYLRHNKLLKIFWSCPF